MIVTPDFGPSGSELVSGVGQIKQRDSWMQSEPAHRQGEQVFLDGLPVTHQSVRSAIQLHQVQSLGIKAQQLAQGPAPALPRQVTSSEAGRVRRPMGWERPRRWVK